MSMSNGDKWRLMVVDDEFVNLEIIREFLDDTRHELHCETSAKRALERLMGSDEAFDLIILDRMMPGMDGIEMLRLVKANPRFRHIPVIMQTAAASPDQVLEGIKAGAYYYLTKPYLPETLRAIVRSALDDLAWRRQAIRAVHAQVESLHLMERAEFRFRTLEQAMGLSGLLASLCPAPEMVAMGLSELLVNAVEHGNLAIDYGEKSRLKREDQWENEIARRLEMPEYRERQATVIVERQPGQRVFSVVDQGEGFDWAAFLEFSPSRVFDPNGRGIAMARGLCFDRLEYQGKGNRVTATVAMNPPVRQSL